MNAAIAAFRARSRPVETTWDDGYPIAPSRRGLAAMLLYIANLMVVLDTTIANVSVPHIAGNLGATTEQGTWVITSYAVAEAITVPLTGWLTVRFGVVRTLLGTLFGFSLFSLLCGVSVTLPMLVACRIGQGLCGGPIMPLAQTLIIRIYPGPQLPRAFGIWTLTVLLGPAIGPIVGGTISDHVSWHWIFLINVPIGIVIGILGYILLRPAESAMVRAPIDKVGMALLVVWIGALQLMLDTGREKDWFADPSIVALAILAVVSLCLFTIWELTEDHPVVDLRLLRNGPFAMCVLSGGLVFGAQFSGIVLVPQWLQSTMGYSATQAGMVTALSAFFAIISSQIALRMMLRFDARILVSVGAIWTGATFLLRTTWSTDMDSFHLMLIFGAQGVGLPFMFMPLNNMAMSSVTMEETASAAGLNSFVRTMSTAIATALALTYWVNSESTSRVGMVDKLRPDETIATLSRVGLPEIAQAAYVSGLVEQQAITTAMLQTFTVSSLAMFFAAAVVWTMPRIELTRLKGTQGPPADAH